MGEMFLKRPKGKMSDKRVFHPRGRWDLPGRQSFGKLAAFRAIVSVNTRWEGGMLLSWVLNSVLR